MALSGPIDFGNLRMMKNEIFHGSRADIISVGDLF